ncbi:MAG: serine/threonine protein kinase [Myxococcales bacterium]|nr:serine/threonine protein kinase [Myxococcales bacterium]
MTRPDEGMVGGVLVGKYELVAHLQPGRFGDFWEGRRLTDHGRVAIKLLKPQLFSNPKAVARFERETDLLASFQHENLLQVLDHGRTHTGVPWVVTEFRRGRRLADVITELSLTVQQVRHIGAQVASVLSAAHSRGIVHRGIDPDAILLVEDGGDPHRVKMQDFGLAHLSPDMGQPALTQAGERLGSFEYMAPEYIEEEVLDVRTDLYSLGIILFEMLAGQPPFVGRPGEVMRKHVYEAPWAPSDLAENPVPKWFDELVLSLLAKDPDLRPSSGETVARALRSAAWPP